MESETFRNILSKFYKLKHHLRSVPNVVSCKCTTLPLERFRPLPYTCSQAVFYKICNDSVERDAVLHLVRQKAEFNSEVVNYQGWYKSNKRKKNYRKMEKDGYVSHLVTDLITHLDNDPDPYFNGGHNWYFTGGCLEVLELDKTAYLFQVVGAKLNTLDIFQFLDETASTVDTFKIQFVEPIFQVFVSDQKTLVVRGLKEVHFYRMDLTKGAFDLIRTVSSSFPIISVLMISAGEVVVLDLRHNLWVWSIGSKRKPKSMQLDSEFEGVKENWGQVVDLDEEHLLIVNRTKLIIVLKTCLTVVHCVNIPEAKLLPVCSQVTGVWKSNLAQDLFYLTSTHDIFALKLNVRNEKLEMEVKIRWTHQLKSAPLMLKATLIDANTEMTIISSHVDRKIVHLERSACVSSGSDEDSDEDEEDKDEGHLNYHSYHYPFNPTDIMDSLKDCLQMGLYLEPRFTFKSRLSLSTIGVEIFVFNGRIILLTLNAVGDLIIQALTTDCDPDADIFRSEMEQAKEQIIAAENMSAKKITATHRANVKHLFNAIVHEANHSAEPEAAEPPKKSKPKWNRPVSKLKKYRDVLSQDMLAVWELSDRSDSEDEQPDVEKEPIHREIRPADKVSNWLFTSANDFQVGLANESQKMDENLEMDESQEIDESQRETVADPAQAENVSRVVRSTRKKRILGF